MRKPLSLSVLKTTKGSTAAVDAALRVQPVQQEEAPDVHGEGKLQADTAVEAAAAFDKKARAHKRNSEQADAKDANLKKKRVEGVSINMP
uniref:4F5 domain-containing protein n=1 Tax=Globodera pallida TaxID=36090 RepID=A0A183CM10_GLOPA